MAIDNPLKDLIGADAIGWLTDDSRQPARGLPSCAYTSEAMLTHEYLRVFAPSWIYVGNAHEIPNPGDVLPVEFFNQPILLIRGHDEKIRAFHNACRHRGTRLVRERSENLRSIVCPYHAWTYDLEGNLRAAPHFGGYQMTTAPGFDLASHGLKALQTETFADWVFVNPDANAVQLGEYLRPLLAEINRFDFSRLRHFLTLDFGDIAANWKLMLENSLENYHVAHVHSETAGQHRLQDHFSITREHCIGTGIDVEVPPHHQANTCIQGEPQTLNMSARYLALMPNFFLVTYAPDILITHFRIPVSATSTIFKVNAYTTSGRQLDAEAIESWRRLALKVQHEDIQIQLEQQAGRRSPASKDGGVISPAFEKSVRAFHRYLISLLR